MLLSSLCLKQLFEPFDCFIVRSFCFCSQSSLKFNFLTKRKIEDQLLTKVNFVKILVKMHKSIENYQKKRFSFSFFPQRGILSKLANKNCPWRHPPLQDSIRIRNKIVINYAFFAWSFWTFSCSNVWVKCVIDNANSFKYSRNTTQVIFTYNRVEVLWEYSRCL